MSITDGLASSIRLYLVGGELLRTEMSDGLDVDVDSEVMIDRWKRH